jgi:pilus assembly protein Flp/PilA
MFLHLYAAAVSRIASLRARSDRGATAVEYGLLAALIAAVIVGIVFTLGGKINNAFSTVSNALP